MEGYKCFLRKGFELKTKRMLILEDTSKLIVEMSVYIQNDKTYSMVMPLSVSRFFLEEGWRE